MGPGARVDLQSHTGSQVGREGRDQAGIEKLEDGWIKRLEAGRWSENSNGLSEMGGKWEAMIGDYRM